MKFFYIFTFYILVPIINGQQNNSDTSELEEPIIEVNVKDSKKVKKMISAELDGPLKEFSGEYREIEEEEDSESSAKESPEEPRPKQSTPKEVEAPVQKVARPNKSPEEDNDNSMSSVNLTDSKNFLNSISAELEELKSERNEEFDQVEKEVEEDLAEESLGD